LEIDAAEESSNEELVIAELGNQCPSNGFRIAWRITPGTEL